MALTENETRVLIWVVLGLVSIFLYIAGLGVSALFQMAKDITSIKLTVTSQAAKHDATEKRVTGLEADVKELKKRK